MPGSDPGPTFQPVVGGFASCIAVDPYENILLRSARGDGELLILWAKGTHGWVSRITDRASRVPLPITPREEASPPVEEVLLPAAEVESDPKVAEWKQALVSGAGWQEDQKLGGDVSSK